MSMPKPDTRPHASACGAVSRRARLRRTLLLIGVLTCLAAVVGAAPERNVDDGGFDLALGMSALASAVPGIPARRSRYDEVVAADRPTAHLRGRQDLVTGRWPGRAEGDVTWVRMPDGALVPRFSGAGQYLRFPDAEHYSIATTGQLTVEFWLRPDRLQFLDEEGSGYVHVLGKGNPGEQEWYARMYSERNDEERPSRLSGYVFKPEGGRGAGAYVQDPVRVGQWIQLVLVFDQRPTPGAPTGTVTLYKDGVLRDSDALIDFEVVPRVGGAPLRIGTGYRRSYFAGAIGDVVFFDRVLPPKRIRAHYRALWRPGELRGDPAAR